ncbi:hypothetical protein HZS_6122 [Henneguya salminicola]|nr:hypothetical protein HZS_6122 [Henneguya salminicola]
MNLINPKLIQTTIFEEFWKYFVKTWIGSYGTKLWNIHEIDDKEIIGRANTALGHYNRKFGEVFMNSRPNRSVFVLRFATNSISKDVIK